MKSRKINLPVIAELLRDRCPFIIFALLTGHGEDGLPGKPAHFELSVYIDPGTGALQALEQILPVMEAALPGLSYDMILLNRVDATTRFRAARGECLFIRENDEQSYRQFVKHAILEYRIMRARGRRLGIIDNA